MLEPDAGPTRTSGSLKGAGQKWLAPTRPMRLLYHEIAQSRSRAIEITSASTPLVALTSARAAVPERPES